MKKVDKVFKLSHLRVGFSTWGYDYWCLGVNITADRANFYLFYRTFSFEWEWHPDPQYWLE